MAKKNIIKSDTFKLIRQFKAICKEKDLSCDWKNTEDEAILDAINHQNTNITHSVDILVQERQEYIMKIGKDKIEKVLNLK
ncbi:hypothetical protein [Flavobacterium sp. LC2016-01]|uniref:hypothetical protein n=1 Tax=Flavobacterium sp. LC2016-01 TaxID=2675876 RepID=UPI0012BA6457|nr:hypothetical protein [Flavobacterium sp. LC2016-01]MTH13937.1 hypothetical protein [Flavobacterium sp. LC2016-01]